MDPTIIWAAGCAAMLLVTSTMAVYADVKKNEAVEEADILSRQLEGERHSNAFWRGLSRTRHDEANALREKLRDTENERDVAELQLTELEDRNDHLDELLSRQTLELDAARNYGRECDEERKALGEDIHRAAQESKRLKEEVAELCVTNAELADKITELERKASEHQTVLESANTKANAHYRALGQAKKEIKELGKTVAALEREKERLIARLDEAKDKNQTEKS